MRRALTPLLAALVTSTLVVTPAAAMDPPVSPTQSGRTERAAASVDLPAAAPASFTVHGSGWGHGLGMSQFGAYGMALDGRSATNILEHYYAPAKVTTRTDDPTIRVQVRAGVTSVTVSRDSGVTWTLGTAPGTTVSVAASSLTFTYSTASGTARVSTTVDGTQYRTNPSTWPELTLTWKGGVVSVPGANGGSGTVRYKRGSLAFGPLSGAVNTVSVVRLNSEYLYGIAEMPSSWPASALQAQAIAARTYAYRKYQAGVRSSINAHLTDETTDQKYTAYNKEAEAGYGKYWVAAVDATRASGSARVIQAPDGRLSETYYSSSTGGRTTNSEDVWGSATIPYLRSRDDHWSVDPRVRNPYATWTTTITQAQIRAKFPRLSDVARLEVSQRASSGAAMQLKATSTAGSVQYLLARPTTDGVRTALGSRLGIMSAYLSLEAPPAPDPRSDVQRLAGDDRFATAAAIGRAAFPTGRTVVVVSGQQASLVDGLVAAPYARSIKAPVLLSTRSSVPEASMAEITRRGATSAVLVGGTGVLTTDVSAQLRAAGLSVTRLSGADRYATAAAVARAFGSASSVVVASGVTANLVDAAAAGGPAAASGQPVLLVPRSSVPAATRATITALGARSATIVGGTGVVTSGVADALRADGLRLTRLSGTDRYATAAAVADAYEPSVKAGTVVLASGLDANLVDSLTGGVLGRLTLLTAGAGVPAATDRWFAAREVSLLQVLGGTGAVPDSAVEAVR